MKNNKLQRKFRLVGVTLAVVFGVGALSVLGQQNPNGRPNNKDDRGNVTQNKPIIWDDDYDNDRGRNNGGYYGNNNEKYDRKATELIRQFYSDGMKQGIEDARKNRKFSSHKAFEFAMRKMNNGYSNHYKWISKRDLREAFTNGYEKGYKHTNRRFNDRDNRRDDYGYNH